MPRVTYIASDGSRAECELPVGASVMLGALTNGVEGILAECGGAAMCATCHVYVQAPFDQRLPEMGEVENEMLNAVASERRTGSRLGCQIVMTDSLDGLVVRLPDRQN